MTRLSPSENTQYERRRAIWSDIASVRLGLLLSFIIAAPPKSDAGRWIGDFSEIRVSKSELGEIGRKIWINECGGSTDGLTSWNDGEEFASLGIAHFIWYPKGRTGHFRESFPELVAFLLERGVSVPKWLLPGRPCPWSSRNAFEKDFRSPRMNELRQLLAATTELQLDFLLSRLVDAVPKILEDAGSRDRALVQRNFRRMINSDGGLYPLLDYLCFKGDGTWQGERYQGEGWGLSQVLAGMDSEGTAVDAFADSAGNVLERRVKLSPQWRNERRWLRGWLRRISTYTEWRDAGGHARRVRSID
jgi:hypothetical protein